MTKSVRPPPPTIVRGAPIYDAQTAGCSRTRTLCARRRICNGCHTKCQPVASPRVALRVPSVPVSVCAIQTLNTTTIRNSILRKAAWTTATALAVSRIGVSAVNFPQSLGWGISRVIIAYPDQGVRVHGRSRSQTLGEPCLTPWRPAFPDSDLRVGDWPSGVGSDAKRCAWIVVARELPPR